MKTKNLLVLILVLGLSFNAFSQEKITIKQVIKNTAKDKGNFGDNIQVIRISTNLPVTIKPGKENAIYLTGDMNENEKEKLSSFCELKNNVFKINSPYLYIDGVGRVKELYDFTITLELVDYVYAYFLSSRSNVIVKKDIISDGHGLFNLEAHSQMTVEGDVELNVLSITAKKDSKIRFNSIDAELALLTMGEKSIVDFNGDVKDIEIMKGGDGAKLIGDYKNLSLRKHNPDPEFKVNLQLSKNVYFYSFNDIDDYDKDTVYKVDENVTIYQKRTKVSDPNSVEKKRKWYYYEHVTEDFGFQFGYGRLNWSNKVSNVDGLFASPQNQYSLRYGNSWTMGFIYGFKLGWNGRWKISTGIGYESNIFRFDNNVKLIDMGTEKRIGFETNPAIDAKSKLVARYVTLPLFVKFRAVKSLELHVGAIAGVNFKSSSTGFKRNYEALSGEVKERWGTKYDNFKPLKLDLQAGFGWDIMNFYVKYSLTPMFKDNKEIEVYPFSAGISLGL